MKKLPLGQQHCVQTKTLWKIVRVSHHHTRLSCMILVPSMLNGNSKGDDMHHTSVTNITIYLRSGPDRQGWSDSDRDSCEFSQKPIVAVVFLVTTHQTLKTSNFSGTKFQMSAT